MAGTVVTYNNGVTLLKRSPSLLQRSVVLKKKDTRDAAPPFFVVVTKNIGQWKDPRPLAAVKIDPCSELLTVSLDLFMQIQRESRPMSSPTRTYAHREQLNY